MTNDFPTSLVESIMDNGILSGYAVPGDDTVVPVEMYEVSFHNDWLLVTEDVFRSWTGLRRFRGVEVHGPIYLYGDEEQVKPYTGKRACGCGACQEHVEPQFRPN